MFLSIIEISVMVFMYKKQYMKNDNLLQIHRCLLSCIIQEFIVNSFYRRDPKEKSLHNRFLK